MDKKILIIQIDRGGLGDHLFFSHLPRIAKTTGAYDQVLISNKSNIRHLDYKKLIWELNPYVDGFTDSPGIVIYTTYYNEHQNMLDSIMLSYGLDDGKRFHEPEVYYTPNTIPGLSNKNVYDPNFQSYTGDLKSGQLMQGYFNKHNIVIDYQMKFLGARYRPINEFGDEYSCSSIFEFCDFVVSVNEFYCLTTGSATLSSALGKKVNVFYGRGHISGYRHSLMNNYIYLGTDYTFIDYIKKMVGYFYGSLFKRD